MLRFPRPPTVRAYAVRARRAAGLQYAHPATGCRAGAGQALAMSRVRPRHRSLVPGRGSCTKHPCSQKGLSRLRNEAQQRRRAYARRKYGLVHCAAAIRSDSTPLSDRSVDSSFCRWWRPAFFPPPLPSICLAKSTMSHTSLVSGILQSLLRLARRNWLRWRRMQRRWWYLLLRWQRNVKTAGVFGQQHNGNKGKEPRRPGNPDPGSLHGQANGLQVLRVRGQRRDYVTLFRVVAKPECEHAAKGSSRAYCRKKRRHPRRALRRLWLAVATARPATAARQIRWQWRWP